MSGSRLKVVLTDNEDDNRIKLFVLSRSDSVSAAKASRAREWSCEEESFELVSGAQTVPDDTPLSSLPALSSGIVELGVEAKVCVSVRLFGSQREPALLRASLSSRSERLYEGARGVLGIPAERPVRVRAGPAVLEAGSPLREAGSRELEVEVGWCLPEVRADGSRRQVVVFRSDVLQRLASGAALLRCGADTVRTAAVAEAVLQADVEGCCRRPLVLEALRAVPVLREGAVQTQAVGPSCQLPAEAELMVQRQLVACREPPLLPAGWIVHDALRLVVVGPDKRRSVVRVPRDGCVLDLLSAFPFAQRLEARLQDGRVSEETPLLVLQDKEVQLRRMPVAIGVRFGSRQLEWALPEERAETSFGEIVAGVSPRQRAQRQVLMSGVLACEGCGRKLSLEKQAVQRVPSNYCEERSIRLVFAAKAQPQGERGREVMGPRARCQSAAAR